MEPLGNAPGNPGSSPRLLILGAHPDDAEYHAGGLATRYRRLGGAVRMVSVTDGGAGHHFREPCELRRMRSAEFSNSAGVIGAESVVWEFPDGELQCILELRRRIIAEIRSFQPDLVLTHRLNDYHPDHRAVGQAVQDASFLVTVPAIVPHVKALRVDPVVASMVDLFTVPAPFRADVVLDVSNEFPTILRMLECHRSQVFEWLPYNLRIEEQVPESESERQVWLREWFLHCVAPRRERFRTKLQAIPGPSNPAEVLCCEAYEISEYAARPDEASMRRLFPGGYFA